jgi:tetratricopeptide (TPR) repeat protein
VLIIMLVAVIPAFAVTGTFVRADRRFLAAEATRWAKQGDVDLSRGQPDAAVDAYRTALARGADESSVRLQLAQALIAARRPAEAESHLRTLWSEAPGNGTVNLALARLAAGAGQIDAATRYYHAAIDGAWERDPVLARRNARMELAQFLLRHHDRTGARAELIVLSDVAEGDPVLTMDVARMLVDAGDPRTALTLARRVLMTRPSDAGALTLAGEIEFRNANYGDAHRLLARAAREGPLPLEAASALRDAEDAVMLDPLTPRLGGAARLARLRRMLAALQARVDACVMAAGGQPPPELQALADRTAAAGRSAASSRRADADDLDDAMAIAADDEQLPDTACGPSSPDDRTLRLVIRAHPIS